MKFEMIQDDIDCATFGAKSCPIAQCINRVMNINDIYANVQFIGSSKTMLITINSLNLGTWIERFTNESTTPEMREVAWLFDHGQRNEIKPIAFELPLREELYASY